MRTLSQCHSRYQYLLRSRSFFFFFNDTATTEIYTLSLHDALPISRTQKTRARASPHSPDTPPTTNRNPFCGGWRSEEHTSELQSHSDLVCRLLLEKKNIKYLYIPLHHECHWSKTRDRREHSENSRT